MKNKRKRRSKVVLLTILIVGITIGFALLSTTLYINGTAGIKGNTWNIHWDSNSVVETQGSVTAITPASVTDENETNISFEVEFELPGDFYEFTADAVNDGTIDGIIDNVEVVFYMADGTTPYDGSTPEKTLPTDIVYTLTHDDDTAIGENEVIKHGETIGYKFRVGYNSEATSLPSQEVIVKPVINITPVQHRSEPEVIPGPENFSTDSWKTIKKAVEEGDVSKYSVGDTKVVQMDIDDDGTKEDYTVRIANKSTPNDCSGSSYSQTGCGFVVEFATLISTHRMNKLENSGSTRGDGTNGGWEYSDMRAYLNGTVYAAENIDYSETGLINELPVDMRNAIIDTRVVSGHGPKDSFNHTTTDKLYLLATREIWMPGTSATIDYDSATNLTRQLDYYRSRNVTTSNITGAIKQNPSGQNSWWWTRSGYNYSVSGNPADYFYSVRPGGGWGLDSSSAVRWVAPAFRIG